MSTTRKTSKQLSQTTLPFPTKKGFSSQPTKGGAKDEAATTTERVKAPPTAIEARAQAAEARAKAQVAVKQRPAKKQTIVVETDLEESEVEDQLYFEGEKSEPEEEIEEPTEPEVDEIESVVEPEPEVYNVASSSEDEDEAVAPGKGKNKAMGLKDLMKEATFKKHYKEVKEALGGDLTESARKERKATTILRRFDLSYEYGPCIGFTRMERWERADKLGLNPPPVVRQILETSEVDKLSDEDLEALQKSVFSGLV
ncbi:hypothetical protein FRB97_005722 [Tulasnella sp. 331]|nr:hypothetical protein FRB97_005722 [Tulasnella sp. 331]KAG8887145.1 hypothetical protein FRB98_000454 [Tulasnella sp. 332]